MTSPQRVSDGHTKSVYPLSRFNPGATPGSASPSRQRDGVLPLSVRPREAAAMLGISVSSLERLTKTGEIPRLKDGNKVMYRVASLDAWLARREAPEEGQRTEG